MFTNESWRSMMQGASAAIDTAFGESLLITPAVVKANFPPAYSDENAVALSGVFSYRAKQIFGRDADTRRQGGTIIESRDPVASFSQSDLPWQLRRGDMITRLCDGSRFEITAVKPDGVARVTVDLVQLGVSDQ